MYWILSTFPDDYTKDSVETNILLLMLHIKNIKNNLSESKIKECKQYIDYMITMREKKRYC